MSSHDGSAQVITDSGTAPRKNSSPAAFALTSFEDEDEPTRAAQPNAMARGHEGDHISYSSEVGAIEPPSRPVEGSSLDPVSGQIGPSTGGLAAPAPYSGGTISVNELVQKSPGAGVPNRTGTMAASQLRRSRTGAVGADSWGSPFIDGVSAPSRTSIILEQPEDWLGRELGSYKLLAVLGKGGMGCVYRAEHLALGRPVALKVLRADYARRKDAVARFFQEAKAVNRIRHRNIVDVTDLVKLDDDTTFIIMELLDGVSLTRLMRTAGAIDTTRALVLLIQICDGLAAAHSVGIIHRDLKPDNIIVVKTPDGSDLVKVLDFGVAKLLGQEDEDEDVGLKTAVGSVIGTPAYMSPEQAGGLQVDGRSDLYSLGAIMYEVFTGQPLFRAKSFGEYVRKHLSEDPVPPRQTEGGRDLDERIEEIILKCLDKSPNARFASAQELRAELLVLLAAVETGGDYTRQLTEAYVPPGPTGPARPHSTEMGLDSGRTPVHSGMGPLMHAVPGSDAEIPAFYQLPSHSSRPGGHSGPLTPMPVPYGAGPTPMPYAPGYGGVTPMPGYPSAAPSGAYPQPTYQSQQGLGSEVHPGSGVFRASRTPMVVFGGLVLAGLVGLVIYLGAQNSGNSNAPADEVPGMVAAGAPQTGDGTDGVATDDRSGVVDVQPLDDQGGGTADQGTGAGGADVAELDDGQDDAAESDAGLAEVEPVIPPPVTVYFTSDPPDARVISMQTGKQVCVTPCNVRIDPTDGGSLERRDYAVKKRRYGAEEVAINLLHPRDSVFVELKRVPRRGGSGTRTGRTGRTGDKSTSTKETDDRKKPCRIKSSGTLDPFGGGDPCK